MSAPPPFPNDQGHGNMGLDETELSVLWAMAEPNMPYNGGQIIIPQPFASRLTPGNINALKNRLSERFSNIPTMGCVDHEHQVYRICLKPQHLLPTSACIPTIGFPDSDMAGASPGESSESLEDSDFDDTQIRVPGKKSKIPRPPNAFILYRQANHPKIKREQPKLHNNEISIILGKRWKNESEEVKAAFKGVAEKIKASHALRHPGYQYSPRKPGEKKRRMTAKKAAKLHGDSNSATGSNLTAHPLASEHINNAIANHYSTAGLVGLDAYPHPSFVEFPGSNTNSLAMPTGHQEVEKDCERVLLNHLLVGNTVNPVGHVGNAANLPATNLHLAPNLNDIAFMNGLIDWEGIEEDIELVTESATANDITQYLNAEFGPAMISVDDEDVMNRFSQSIDNTLLFN